MSCMGGGVKGNSECDPRSDQEPFSFPLAMILIIPGGKGGVRVDHGHRRL